MPTVTGLHHVSLLIADLERALGFYQGLLGLPLDPQRPDLGYPGAWLQLGAQQIHLLQLPNPDAGQPRPVHPGHDRHLAVSVPALEPLMQALEAAGIPYTRSRSGRRALFCRDPDGNGVELVEQR
jgi:glyoxylase I family protein